MAGEQSPVETAALLPEQHRARRSELHQRRHDEHRSAERDQTGGGQQHVRDPLDNQLQVAGRSDGERQHGQVAEAVKMHAAVLVRKEIGHHAGGHAVLVAQGDHIAQFSQPLGGDSECHFVDWLLGEQARQGG